MSFRKEEKLRIHKEQLSNLFEWIVLNGGTELYSPRIVSSTYFDNDIWSMFYDSEEGSVPRKKIRVRSYSKKAHRQENSALEIKTSSVEGRYKTSTNNFKLQNIMTLGYFDKDYGICKPRVRITYQRAYYRINNVRLTIDQDIEYQALNNQSSNSPYKILEPEIIVEIKAPDNIPIEYLNNKFPFERIRFSKYSKAINSILVNKSIAY